MKIKKALCLLVALAIAASLGAAPVFAEDADVNMDFQEAPNENDGSVDVSEEFAGDVVYDFGIQTPDAEDNGDIDLMSIIPNGATYAEVLVKSENSPLNTYTFTINGSTSYGGNTKSFEGQTGIKITPEPGYKISTARVADGSNIAIWIDDNSDYNEKNSSGIKDFVKYTSDLTDNNLSYVKGGSIEIPYDDLVRTTDNWGGKSKEGKGQVYFASRSVTLDSSDDPVFGNQKKGLLTIIVETEQLQAGTVSITAKNKEKEIGTASYTFNGITVSGLTNLSSIINSHIKNSKLAVGTQLSFTYNAELIQSVEAENGANIIDSNGTVAFSVPDSENNLSLKVTFRTMSKPVTIASSVEEKNEPSGMQYRFNNSTYYNIHDLNAAIQAAIGTTTPAKTPMSFTYTGNAISNITSNNVDGFTYVPSSGAGTVRFNTSGTESQTITVTFKEKAGGVKFGTGNGFPTHVTGVTVNGQSFGKFDEFNNYLKSLYADTVVNMEFTLDNNYKIADSDVGMADSDGKTVKGIKLASEEIVINLTIAYTGTPKITFSSLYTLSNNNTDISNGYNKGYAVVAEVVNVEELDPAILNGATISMNGTISNTNNPNENLEKNLTAGPVSVEKNTTENEMQSNYVGFVFKPKFEKGINYSYTVDIMATMRYNNDGEAKTATATTSVTIRPTVAE